jgi:signal transduction histidine kinase
LLAKWPIRVKFLVGLGLLLLLMFILSSGGLYSTYTYRSLVKDLSWRAEEMPLSGELSRRINDLRLTVSEVRGLRATHLLQSDVNMTPLRLQQIRISFPADFQEVEEAFARYRDKLESEVQAGSPISDNHAESQAAHQIDAALERLRDSYRSQDWVFDSFKVDQLDQDLASLQQQASKLPGYFHSRMRGFADEVKSQYRMLIVGTWITSLSACMVLLVFIRLFYRWVFSPLRVLIDGSRRVAFGQFGYRIRLDTHDEMAELGNAMNGMTERFQAIRDDLDRQVQEQTKQIVRSEQLASVGFLAAGVAHEINNPLASIAMCAESMESRVHDILDPTKEDHAVILHYLQMIQSEAFRCKGITEKLLDFSRIGPAKRQAIELGELVQGVIDMVGHLGKYHGRQLQLDCSAPVVVLVNPQEIKQVVLNLLANALDSTSEGGKVQATIRRRADIAELAVADDGCGMAPEILDHVFEPFFTRRKEGQGTGLGLSISYRIVADHGGTIEAESQGPGLGATFRMRLPVKEAVKENDHQYRAA